LETREQSVELTIEEVFLLVHSMIEFVQVELRLLGAHKLCPHLGKKV